MIFIRKFDIFVDEICIHKILICLIILLICILHLGTWIQNNENLFNCPNKNCHRNYKTKPGLYNHLKYECNVPPKFHCNICNKKFKQPGNFKIHMKSLHLVTLVTI